MVAEEPLRPLILSKTEFLQVAQACAELASQHVFGIDRRPVFRPMDKSTRREILDQSLPETGFSPTELLSYIERCLMPYPMGNGHPRFFGWVNSPPAMMAILTELLAAAMNRSCAGGHHSAVYLEHCATRWLKELVGSQWMEAWLDPTQVAKCSGGVRVCAGA